MFINFNTKKVIFISFLHLHSGKKLPLIILVYRLHSIFTYVGCHSSIKCNLPHQFLPLLVIIAIRIRYPDIQATLHYFTTFSYVLSFWQFAVSSWTLWWERIFIQMIRISRPSRIIPRKPKPKAIWRTGGSSPWVYNAKYNTSLDCYMMNALDLQFRIRTGIPAWSKIHLHSFLSS